MDGCVVRTVSFLFPFSSLALSGSASSARSEFTPDFLMGLGKTDPFEELGFGFGLFQGRLLLVLGRVYPRIYIYI